MAAVLERRGNTDTEKHTGKMMCRDTEKTAAYRLRREAGSRLPLRALDRSDVAAP